jgi:hypothetical protein
VFPSLRVAAALAPTLGGRDDRCQRDELSPLADFKSAIAVFFTKTYTRIVNTSLAELEPRLREPIADATALGEPLAPVRSRARRPNQTSRLRDLKLDPCVNLSTAKRS